VQYLSLQIILLPKKMIQQKNLFMISYNHGFYKTYEHEIKSLITSNILQVHLAYAKHLLMHYNMVYSMTNFIANQFLNVDITILRYGKPCSVRCKVQF